MKQLMLVISAWMTLVVGAETRTWLANVDGDWNTPGMWSGGAVPGGGDTADLSNLTGEKTLTLPAAVTVDQIVYAPAVGSATNKVTLTGSALSVNTSITVGERALLETSCDVRITYIHGYLYTYGPGEWRIAKTLKGDNGSDRKLYQREGRITLASGASMGYGVNLYPGTIDAALSPAEFVVEEDATVNFDKVNDFEFAQAANSRFVFTMNGGTLLPRNANNGGCLLNALAEGSISTMNINAGFVDGTGKTFWPSFKGTGVVNQTGGKMVWKTISANNIASACATYNLTGGELWLVDHISRSGRTFNLNVGDAKIVKTGTGNLDVTSPLTITDRMEVEVPNADHTCGISCIMEGVGGFVKTGPGTLNWYSAEKRFTGPLVVSNGTVLADVNMPGGNAVTVAGGTLRLYRNRPYTFSSLTICGTGTLQTTNTATVNLPATANVITVKDNGVLALDAGTSCFPGTPLLVIEGDGQVRIPAGATQWFPSVKVGADDLPDGVYTSATADFVDGDGTLVVGNHVWTGAAGDGLWTTAGNWQGGASPFALSGGVDLSAAEGTLTLDAAVTNTALVYAPSGGGVLTNSSAAVLSLAAGSVITVGAGSTLVLDGDVCLLGGSVYKRGGGTLVFAKRMTAGTVGTYPTVYLRVQEGRCVFEGAVKDVSLYSGLWSGSVLTEIPEIVFGPESSLSGVTYLAGVTSDASVDPAPGNGLITQLGGNISPSSGWGTAATMAQGRQGQVAATGTYHLVSGSFVVPSGKTMALAEFNSYGIFTQDGGESSIATIEYNDSTRCGEVNLNGGRMTVGAVGRNNQIRFNFAGGTFAPAGGTLAIPNPWALIGNATFDTPEGDTLTFTQVPSGSGGLSKAGAGTLNLSGGVAQSNDVTVAEGALSVGAGSVFGTLALAADATVSLVGVSTATNFTLAGMAQPGNGAFYSKENCPQFITGDGVLLVGGVPGKWNGGADDGKWSSAGNWSGNIIPNGATMDVDLAAAAGTLSFDAGAVTVGSLSYAMTGGAGTLTNAAPVGSAENVLNIVDKGVVTVGEGETLVLDHPLCMLGQDAYKRGKGTLVLRQGMCSPANRATLDNYFSIEEGVVINEGCVTNVIPVPGAIDRSDPTNVPQFINRAGASLVGTTFIDAMHSRDNPPNPGNGLFTQEGGLVEPNIANWSVRGIVGYAPAGASAGGTGTYHLVKGTLRIPTGKVFHMASSNGHGVFVQDGGLFENNGTFGMGNRCSVTLNGGTMRLTTVENQKPIIFSGGVFRPLPAAFTFGSSFEMTGDGAFEVDAGKTMTLNAANPLRGNAPLNKAGEGVLAITGTGAGMTGPVNVDAGTLRLAGALPNATNFNVAAGATLEVATGTASFNAQTVLRVAKDGKLNLTGTGSVSVDALWLEERPQYGFGRRYGSSSHTGEVDIVDDKHFVGTGVLVVVGKSLGAGTTIILR